MSAAQNDRDGLTRPRRTLQLPAETPALRSGVMEDIEHIIRPGDDLTAIMKHHPRWTEESGTNPGSPHAQQLPALSAPSSLDAIPASQRPPVPPPLVESETEFERPPPGCAPDAIKLFVGSIPKQYTESQLLPFFETIGKVVDLVIVRDKLSRESKGSAFLWYATRAHAEMAILQFNLRHVLPNPNGEHNRPLVLRRAKLRTQAQARQSPSGSAGSGGLQTLGSNTQPVAHYTHPSMGPGRYTAGMQGMLMPVGHGPYYSTMPAAQPHPVLLSDMMGQVQVHTGHAYGDPMRSRSQYSQSRSSQQSQSIGSYASSRYQTYSDTGGSSSVEDVDAMMMALRSVQIGGDAAGAAAASAASVMTSVSDSMESSSATSVSLDLTSQQLAVVNEYMHSVQSISGAKLTISVGGGPGLFRLTVCGGKAKVETAKALLSTVIHVM